VNPLDAVAPAAIYCGWNATGLHAADTPEGGNVAPAPLRIVMEIAELKETLTVDKSDHQVSTEPGENMDVIRLGPSSLQLAGNEWRAIAALSQLLGPAALGSEGASIIVDGLPATETRILSPRFRKLHQQQSVFG